MSKHDLFELIRKEQVVLWVGAGMSLDAGYPNGTQLAKLIFNDLAESDKLGVNVTDPLNVISQHYVDVKNGSRKSLLKLLCKIFNQAPKTIEIHKSLSLIPHFKTIVTTNYDTLLEQAYGLDAVKVSMPVEISSVPNDKVEILKVHGDLSSPNIILTKSDYREYFQKNLSSNPLWSVVKERFITKHILFIGYGLEDDNVLAMYDDIKEALGTYHKKCFLIAPYLSNSNLYNLNKRNIEYITQTGGEFIQELHANIKDNICKDFALKYISADTLTKYLSNFDLNSKISSENGSLSLLYIEPAKQDVPINLTFTTKGAISEKLDAFLKDTNTDGFRILTHELHNFEMRFSGIDISQILDELFITPIAQIDEFIDIKIPKRKIYQNVHVVVYRLEKFVEVHLTLLRNTIKIKIDYNMNSELERSFKIEFKHNEYCNNVKDEIDLYTFLADISAGCQIDIIYQNQLIHRFSTHMLEVSTNPSSERLSYFQNLDKIEEHYDVSFSNFQFVDVNDKNLMTINEIMIAINQIPIERPYQKPILIQNDDPESMTYDYASTINKLSNILVHIAIETVFELHGVNINIGYQVVNVHKPQVVNLKELKKTTSKIFKVISKINKINLTYTKLSFPEIKSQNN